MVVLCFYGLHPSDQSQWEEVGYRTGFVAACQLPLIVLLAGKNNIIGFLVGVSYERLSWLHRWTARVLLLTVTMHMGFWFADWYRYDYIKIKIMTDSMTRTGFAAWAILVWVVFSSMAPLRRWNYEFFVVQHIVTYAGFLAAVYLHLDPEVKIWIWLPIAFVVLDRTLRSLRVLYINILLYHPTAKSERFWASKATFEPLDSETTRIVISKPPISWTAGQHVLLSCHAIAPLQSHPFTIASIPSDGRMEFIVKSKSGGTKRYLRHAEKVGLPVIETPVQLRQQSAVTIEGPYGRIRPLKQFDSVMLIAGSSGGTFILPLLRDVVQSWKSRLFRQLQWPLGPLSGAATRYLRCVWVVKSRAQYNWFSRQLAIALRDVEQLRRQGQDVELDISIYVTCDEEFVTGSEYNPPSPGCGTRCNGAVEPATQDPELQTDEKVDEDRGSLKSSSSSLNPPKHACGPNGTCCCQSTIEDEDAITSATPCECNCAPYTEPPTLEDDNEKPTSPTKSIQPPTPTAPSPPTNPSITMLSGRPQPQNLIRKMLEQALGESAVVVCGPRGLVDNVRQSVVCLSDERAIHKGTGAQGCYLHAEAFDY